MDIKEKIYKTFIECILDISKGINLRVNDESFKLIFQNLANEKFPFKRVTMLKSKKMFL